MSDIIRTAGARVARSRIDWTMFGAAVTLSLFGLVTMNSFTGENAYFDRQILWLCVSVIAFFAASFVAGTVV